MPGVLEQEGYDLIGAAIEVYNEMGRGFLEDVYQECLEYELVLRGIPFEAQPSVKLWYKGCQLTKTYRPDLLVYGAIVVELNAIGNLGNHDSAQLLNYLRSANKRVGYLINFGATDGLEWKRFIL